MEIDISVASIISTINKSVLTANLFTVNINSVVYIKNPLFFDVSLPETTYNLMYEDTLLGTGVLEGFNIKPDITEEKNISIKLNNINIAGSILESIFSNDYSSYYIEIYADTLFGRQLVFTVKE